MKKSMLGLLLMTVVVICVGCKSDEEELIGKWYKLDVEKNEYLTNEYFEFYDDGMFQTGDGETGNYEIQDDKITLNNENIGTVEMSYNLIYENSKPKKLELIGPQKTLTFISAETVK